MFDYSKIPDIELEDIAQDVNKKIFKRMPKKLVEFCRGVESDDKFYSHHTNFGTYTKTLQSFHKQIYNYLEALGAVEYTIETSLQNACINSPLGITYIGRFQKGIDDTWKIKDIPMLYRFELGRLWLPAHHEAKVTQYGKVPESVAEILRGYIKYALKCGDKDFDELQKELIILANAGVIDTKFYDQIAGEINKTPEQKQQILNEVQARQEVRQNQKQ